MTKAFCRAASRDNVYLAGVICLSMDGWWCRIFLIGQNQSKCCNDNGSVARFIDVDN